MAKKFTIILRAVYEDALTSESTGIVHRESVYENQQIDRQHIVPILSDFLAGLGYGDLKDPDAHSYPYVDENGEGT